MSAIEAVKHWLRPPNWSGVESGMASQAAEVICKLEAEIERLREALQKIAAVKAYDQPSAVQGWEDRGRIAREALKGGDDDE